MLLQHLKLAALGVGQGSEARLVGQHGVQRARLGRHTDQPDESEREYLISAIHDEEGYRHVRRTYRAGWKFPGIS